MQLWRSGPLSIRKLKYENPQIKPPRQITLSHDKTVTSSEGPLYRARKKGGLTFKII